MLFFLYKKGGYPDSNREQTVPHTVTLPLSYTHLNLIYFVIYNILNKKEILCTLCWSGSNTQL